MDGDAPFPHVNPESLTGTGALFDGIGLENQAGPAIDNTAGQPPFLPFGHSLPRTRTTYGPLRQPHHNPTLAPSPPSSPTRVRLDPTAPAFTPKQSPSRLSLETSTQKELATPTSPAPLSPTPRTPGIQLTLVGGSAFNAAALQGVGQYPWNRRQTSIRYRPVGAQRHGSVSGRPTSMSWALPGPGWHDEASANYTISPVSIQPVAQQAGYPFLAPAQPMTAEEWLPQVPNTGFDERLHKPRTLSLMAAPPPPPPAPRSMPSRYGGSNRGSGPIVCDYPGCRHFANGKTFKTLGELRKHWKTHAPKSERPFGCHVRGCEHRFLWEKDLKRHVRVVHDKVKVRCPHCDEELCREDDLSRHIASVHNRHAADPRNWAAPSPSASSVTSFAMTPRSEWSFAIPSTPPTGSSFASGSRARMPHLASFDSIPEDGDDAACSVPMMKSLTR